MLEAFRRSLRLRVPAVKAAARCNTRRHFSGYSGLS